MRRWLIISCLLLLTGLAARAEGRTWQVTETGWGRVHTGISIATAYPERTMGEMSIHRWRKAPGTLKVDFDKREATLSLNRKKDKTYILMTESQPSQTRDGWTFVEYEALDGRNAGCRFWLCKHESGAERLLIFYPFGRPDTVYGYLLSPAN